MHLYNRKRIIMGHGWEGQGGGVEKTQKNQNMITKNFYTEKLLAFAREKSFCHKITNRG